MNSDGYLGMSIPIINHSNLSRYERILTTDHDSQRKIHAINYIKQLTYKPTFLHKEGDEEEKEDEHL